MPISISKKNAVSVRIEKHGMANVHARVGTANDVSGSMIHLYQNGSMTEFNKRLVPIALRMDDNGELDAKCFDSKCYDLPPITESNCDDYVQNYILTPHRAWGGTSFAPVIESFYNDWFPDDKRLNVKSASKGIFSRWLGLKAPEAHSETVLGQGDKPKPLPAILFLETDGDNHSHDQIAVDKMLSDIRNSGMYIIFFAVGTESTTDFHFIRSMAEKYEHVGFYHVADMALSNDEDVYDGLLTQELSDFLKKHS